MKICLQFSPVINVIKSLKMKVTLLNTQPKLMQMIKLLKKKTYLPVRNKMLLKKNMSPPQLLMTNYFNVKNATSNLLQNMA